MPGIIDATQAAAFAARAAAVAAAGTLKGSFTARRPRATFADGSPLAAGDNARLTSTARGIDRIIRVTSRTDPWRGPVQIEFEAERGMFAALPPVVPDIRPDFGKQIPDEITRLRIWELPAALSGQFAPPEGSTMLAFLARKPLSRAKDNPDVTGQSVIGFQLQESPSGATYDIQGTQTTWAAAAKLTTAITAAAVTVTIDLDAQNLDLDSYIGQSAAQQANNTLLLIVGTEVMSVGTVTLNPQNGLRRTLAVLRGRLKTTAAAAAVNADAWLVFAEDITAWSHADWLPNSERWFKLLPYTPAATLNAEDADPIHYHFLPPPPSPPAATPPEIEFHTYSNTVETGRPFNISATITAPSEDIKTVITALILLNADGTDGPEQLLLVATPAPINAPPSPSTSCPPAPHSATTSSKSASPTTTTKSSPNAPPPSPPASRSPSIHGEISPRPSPPPKTSATRHAWAAGTPAQAGAASISNSWRLAPQAPTTTSSRSTSRRQASPNPRGRRSGPTSPSTATCPTTPSPSSAPSPKPASGGLAAPNTSPASVTTPLPPAGPRLERPPRHPLC